jgi:deoxyribose-phosphate aldolase
VTQTELERLVAQIGEEILARGGGSQPASTRKAEGLNLPAEVSPGGVGRCDEKCSKDILASGADRVSCSELMTRIDPAIAALIDHTILKPDATRDDVVKVCREARQYCFASVCVNPCWVPLAHAELAGSPVLVCSVVGFPLGATFTEVKVVETAAAVRAGAREIDMVINVGALRSGDRDAVREDIRQVVLTAHGGGAAVKVIIEAALLDDNQKAVACTLAKLAGADFVKTSTGFGPGGATAHDVALMRGVVGPEMGVKAAGGIRTIDDLRAMVAAGATRIGASASIKIVEATAA